jgi:septal ring factor EnvC (AmiA/AmiB activator)
MKAQNEELAIAYGKKDEENRQLAQIAVDFEKRQKKASAATKEASKLKKSIKDKEKEIKKI